MTARCVCGERIKYVDYRGYGRRIWVHVGSGQFRCPHGGNIAQPARTERP